MVWDVPAQEGGGRAGTSVSRFTCQWNRHFLCWQPTSGGSCLLSPHETVSSCPHRGVPYLTQARDFLFLFSYALNEENEHFVRALIFQLFHNHIRLISPGKNNGPVLNSCRSAVQKCNCCWEALF